MEHGGHADDHLEAATEPLPHFTVPFDPSRLNATRPTLPDADAIAAALAKLGLQEVATKCNDLGFDLSSLTTCNDEELERVGITPTQRVNVVHELADSRFHASFCQHFVDPLFSSAVALANQVAATNASPAARHGCAQPRLFPAAGEAHAAVMLPTVEAAHMTATQLKMSLETVGDAPASVARLNADVYSAWVEQLEAIEPWMVEGIAVLLVEGSKSSAGGGSTGGGAGAGAGDAARPLKRLIAWVVAAVAPPDAVAGPFTTRTAKLFLRQMKAGLKLAHAIFASGSQLVHNLIQCGLQETLLQLLNIGLPPAITQEVICVLDVSLDSIPGLERFHGLDSTAPSLDSGLQHAAEKTTDVRVATSILALDQKAQLYVAIVNLNNVGLPAPSAPTTVLLEEDEVAVVTSSASSAGVASAWDAEQCSNALGRLEEFKTRLLNVASTIQAPVGKLMPNRLAQDAAAARNHLPPMVFAALASRRTLEYFGILLTKLAELGSAGAAFGAIREIILFLLSTSAGAAFIGMNQAATAHLGVIFNHLDQESSAQQAFKTLLPLRMYRPSARASPDAAGVIRQQLHPPPVCTPQQLRLLTEYHLQAVKAVDGIWAAMSSVENKETLTGGNADAIDMPLFASFHDALAVANTAAGRSAVAETLLELDAVPALLELLDKHGLETVPDADARGGAAAAKEMLIAPSVVVLAANLLVIVLAEDDSASVAQLCSAKVMSTSLPLDRFNLQVFQELQAWCRPVPVAETSDEQLETLTAQVERHTLAGADPNWIDVPHSFPVITMALRLIANQLIEPATRGSSMSFFCGHETGKAITSFLTNLTTAISGRNRRPTLLMAVIECTNPLLKVLRRIAASAYEIGVLQGDLNEMMNGLLLLHATLNSYLGDTQTVRNGGHTQYISAMATAAMNEIGDVYLQLMKPHSEVLMRLTESKLQSVVNTVCLPAWKQLVVYTTASPANIHPGLELLGHILREIFARPAPVAGINYHHSYRAIAHKCLVDTLPLLETMVVSLLKATPTVIDRLCGVLQAVRAADAANAATVIDPVRRELRHQAMKHAPSILGHGNVLSFFAQQTMEAALKDLQKPMPAPIDGSRQDLRQFEGLCRIVHAATVSASAQDFDQLAQDLRRGHCGTAFIPPRSMNLEVQCFRLNRIVCLLEDAIGSHASWLEASTRTIQPHASRVSLF
jgi:hypothetical protein